MYRGIIPLMGKGQAPFIIEVKTDNVGSSTTTQFTVPTTGAGYSYTVKTSEQTLVGQTGNVTLQWSVAGTYDVEIYGNFPRIYFNDTGDKLKILKVKQWGGITWTTFALSFWGCANLDVTATDTPKGSFTNMQACFYNCTNLTNSNASIGSWNVSAVTDMVNCFRACNSFNINLGSWNVSSVTNFSQMFVLNTAFNNGGSTDIQNWKIRTTGTVNMSSMFNGAQAFNQPVNTNGSNWVMSAVTNIQSMFQGALVFNQPLSSWNTSAITNMRDVFNGAIAFNQNLGSWNVSAVSTFLGMFQGATLFNNGGSSDIQNWVIKTSGTVTMSSMFRSSAFNQPINTSGSSWITSNVTDMSSMFLLNTAFNQNIGSWNVSAVTTMASMFQSASSFNQNIGSWNVSSVNNFSFMFASSTFNQDITGWNVLAATTLANMFSSNSAFNYNLGGWQLRLAGVSLVQIFQSASAMSTANYTDTIVGWANYVYTNSGTPNNVSMINQAGRTFKNSLSGGATFANAGAARTYLTSTVTPVWQITGDTIIA